MKGFLKKRWHGIPVAIVSASLAVLLIGGGAVYAAAYGFFTATITVDVEEAIYPSYGAEADDLAPYMIPESGVLPLITFEELVWNDTDPISFGFTITGSGADASEFVAGDVLVLPINLRNRGDGTLTVKATCTATPGLTLEYGFGTNVGGASYKYAGVWTSTSDFTATLTPHGGSFGSAQIGATVLFIKVAPQGAPGLAQTFTITFTRE